MNEYIDLTGWIENGMWDYSILPGLEEFVPPVQISEISIREQVGFFSSRLGISTITGTYLEAGSHIIKDGKNLDCYSLEDFIKPAAVVHIKGLGPRDLITREHISSQLREVPPGYAVLIDTGWSQNWNAKGYVIECPNYDADALKWILDKKPSILGVDVPCIEAAWSEEKGEQKGSMLQELFRSGCLLAAPLVNLEEVTTNEGTLFCLPLKVKGVSGSPARIMYRNGS